MERSPSATEQPQGLSRNDFGPSNPQPPISNPPGFRPYNRFNFRARVRENLPYFKTTIGILKILSVVFGLIASVLAFYAFSVATAFKSHRKCDHGAAICAIISSTPPPCHRSKSNFCELNTYFDYFEDRLCDKGRSVKACVNIVLVIIPLILVLITCQTSLGALFRILLVLRERLQTRKFFRIEKYGNLLAAFLVILSALLLISYFAQVKQEDLCGNENLKAEATDYVINGPKPNSSSPIGRRFIITTTTEQTKEQTTGSSSTSSTTTSSSDQHELRQNSVEDSNKIDMVLANLTRQCPEKQQERYYHWHFLFAAIFAIITGIIYILIAALSIKESSHAVEPVMMVMGPNGPQQRPTSQPQMESATHL